MQIQEGKRILNTIDINRTTSRHIVIKMANKQRGQTSESSKGEDKPQINGKNMKIRKYLPYETVQARTEQNDIQITK